MADNEITDVVKERSYKVVKANKIIQKARYDLTITELKTLAFIFSKIKPTDSGTEEFTFSIQEYCNVCGIDNTSGKNYKAIKDSLKALRDKSFWVMQDDGTEVTVGWLSKVKLSRGSGKIRVILDPDMQKYLIGLYENFTEYELLSTLPMRSSYSFRIYELLKSYAFTKSHTFDIDELKHSIAAEHYVNFKDFRRFVIEKAVKEINAYTDLEVTWEPIKKGRKVIKVKFYIKQRDSWGRVQAGVRAQEALSGHQMSIDEYMHDKNK